LALPPGAYAATPSDCNWNGYDFTAIGATTLYTNDYANAGVTYAFRMCGVVNDSACLFTTSPTSTMFCQHQNSYGPFLTESLAEWPDYASGVTSSAITWSWVNGADYSQGVRMTIQDGTSCGGYGDRTSKVTLVCDPSATTPVAADVFENPTCTYNIIVRTNVLCTPPSGNAVHGPGSSLSSGGLVAAIIIPLIVVFIVLTICFVCCITGGSAWTFSSTSKPKQFTTENQSGNGKYAHNELEESQATEMSEVEPSGEVHTDDQLE